MRPPKRSRVLALALGSLFSLGLAAGPACAQKISMATWGGGVGETWRNSFGKLFQEATGTPVTITEVPNPEAQVRAQKGSPQYNAVIATYFEAANMNKDGLIETFDVADFPEIKNIAEKYRLLDGNGRLLGMPVYFMYYGIALNTDNAKAAEFASWADLAKPKWKGQLALNRPIYASTYDLTVLAYATGGNEKNIEPGMKLYEQIAQNGMTAFSSMAQMNQLLTRGEIAGGAYYSTRIWQMKREGLTNVEFVVPKEGALMLPYLVVVPKGAPDMAAAKKWLDFVGKADPQLRATEISGYMPLNETAVLPPPLEKIVGMPLAVLKPKLIQPDWAYIAEKQKERVAFVEKTIAGIK
ncbi:extracellular solute-binding protein [Enterovirga sp. CN4-39]|uniref:extracellular solute-binding protein n=1 Tax=Enterovirga sp. CN4-39 TaxID=3400910 RepID=UPI003C102FC2